LIKTPCTTNHHQGYSSTGKSAKQLGLLYQPMKTRQTTRIIISTDENPPKKPNISINENKPAKHANYSDQFRHPSTSELLED
jgi:hypothetical protein